MADSSTDEQQLTLLLEQAADGIKGAPEAFFASLLRSKLYVALKPGFRPETNAALVGTGKDHLADYGFALVDYQGTQTLPLFTEEEFATNWSETDIHVAAIDFSKLLWLIGDEMWLYINPSQEVGKEITPWEIQQLRKGDASIPDLVAALSDDFQEDLVVRAEPELFGDFKVALRPILELYPELQEAFLVTIKEGDEGEEKPTLGVKYAGITDAKKIYLRSELENASEEHLPGHQQLFVVDDLENPDSPNWRLFADATPFYISQRKLPETKSSLLTAAGRRFRQFIGRRGDKPGDAKK